MSSVASAILASMAILCTSLAAQTASRPRGASSTSFSASQKALLNSSMRLAEERFDPVSHLLRTPTGALDSPERQVRESAWYALGLLERNDPNDCSRAAAILDAVLAQQYLDPTTKWYGAFKRTPGEPLPKAGINSHDPNVIGYDPNWREFIGTTFETILIKYPNRVPASLAKRMNQAIDVAVRGELNDGHVPLSYSNIALLFGALLDYSSIHHPELRTKADAWTDAVYRLFTRHSSFEEYNSPTYYGVDLLALALWRSYGSTPRIRSIGAEMESALWNDIADFYSPELHNIAGPYDRAYGMDMESYVAELGMWIATIVSAPQAPLPPIAATTNHVSDIYSTSELIALGAYMTPQTHAKFQSFVGPHLVTRRIDDQRVAAAWIGTTAIWGAEFTSQTRDTVPGTQFHPVTVQWRTPDGGIAWIQLTQSPKIDATADRNGITINAVGDVSFRIFAPGTKPVRVTSKLWNLPGLCVAVEADEKHFSITKFPTEPLYTGVTRIRLSFEQIPRCDTRRESSAGAHEAASSPPA